MSSKIYGEIGIKDEYKSEDEINTILKEILSFLSLLLELLVVLTYSLVLANLVFSFFTKRMFNDREYETNS